MKLKCDEVEMQEHSKVEMKYIAQVNHLLIPTSNQ